MSAARSRPYKNIATLLLRLQLGLGSACRHRHVGAFQSTQHVMEAVMKTGFGGRFFGPNEKAERSFYYFLRQSLLEVEKLVGLFRETEKMGADFENFCGLFLFHSRLESHPLIDMALRLACNGKRATPDSAETLYVLLFPFNIVAF